MVAAVGFDIENADDIWIPDWGVEIELDLDVCQELGIAWLPNLNAVGGGLLFDQKVANHGTLTNGPTWTKGKFGEPAISLSGSGIGTAAPYIALPSTLSGSIGSIIFWAKPANVYNSGEREFLWGQNNGLDGGSPNSEFCFQHFIDNNLYVGWNISGGGDDRVVVASSSTNWIAGEWQMYGFTWANGGTSYLYRNADLLGSQGSCTTASLSSALMLGTENVTVSGSYAGDIAGVTVSNIALSANQIAELYRNPFLLYWQPSRTSIFDMRYDPTPYERPFRDIEDTYAAITNPANIKEIDGTYGTIGPYFDNLYTFFISNEGRLLPAGVTITGFQIRVVSKSASNDTFLDRIQVYKGVDGYDVPVSSGSGLYPIGTTDTEYTFGGSTELFGTTWTSSDRFGIEISFYIGIVGTDTLSIDGIELTTWYSDGSSFKAAWAVGKKSRVIGGGVI